MAHTCPGRARPGQNGSQELHLGLPGVQGPCTGAAASACQAEPEEEAVAPGWGCLGVGGLLGGTRGTAAEGKVEHFMAPPEFLTADASFGIPSSPPPCSMSPSTGLLAWPVGGVFACSTHGGWCLTAPVRLWCHLNLAGAGGTAVRATSAAPLAVRLTVAAAENACQLRNLPGVQGWPGVLSGVTGCAECSVRRTPG